MEVFACLSCHFVRSLNSFPCDISYHSFRTRTFPMPMHPRHIWQWWWCDGWNEDKITGTCHSQHPKLHTFENIYIDFRSTALAHRISFWYEDGSPSNLFGPIVWVKRATGLMKSKRETCMEYLMILIRYVRRVNVRAQEGEGRIRPKTDTS